MNGYDQRNTVILLRQDPTEMGVPRVTMHQVGVDRGAVEIGAATNSSKHGAQWLRAGEKGRVDLKAVHGKVSLLQTLVTEATNVYWHELAQLARQILHVHAGASVGVRRVFIRKKEEFQASGVLECWSEATTESLSL